MKANERNIVEFHCKRCNARMQFDKSDNTVECFVENQKPEPFQDVSTLEPDTVIVQEPIEPKSDNDEVSWSPLGKL